MKLSQMLEDKIVKGGKSIHFPFASYRQGYDIVQRNNGKYYMSIMNGPFEIFKGPEADTEQEAEKIGKMAVIKDNPILARNTGITKESVEPITEVYGARKLFKGSDRKQQHLGYEIDHAEKIAMDTLKRIDNYNRFPDNIEMPNRIKSIFNKMRNQLKKELE
jgi:hypothetical protein